MGHFGRGRDRGLRGILILAASIGAAVLTSAGPSLGAAAPEGPLRCAVGGPDAYGYQFIDSQEPDGPVFADEWENISSTGTAVNFAQLQNQPYGAGDEGEALVPLGFPFRFYGNEYTQCYVITNGLVKFGSPGAAYAWTPGTIPSAGGDDNKICVKWQDWIGTTARYATLGTSPNQRFVVNWVLGGNNVELKLHENGDIIMLYQSVSGGGTAGIEDSTGAVGLSYAPPNSLVANRAVRFYAGYPPNPPTGLLQAAEAGGPAWPVNFISDATVYLRGTVTDPDTGDRVGLEVEVLPSGTPFQTDVTGDTARTAPADLVLNGGEPEALYTFTGSPFGSGEYHWRARSFDANGNTSAWATYDPAATHIRVDLDPPTIPEAVYPLQDRKVSAGGDRFVWLLSEDVGPPGPIKYEFEADNSESFTNLPVADFAIDETRGILVLPLSRDPFFWHVRAIDRAGNASPWSPTIRFFTKGDDGIDHAAGDAPDSSAGCSAGRAQASNGMLLLLGLLAVAGVRVTLARRVPQE